MENRVEELIVFGTPAEQLQKVNQAIYKVLVSGQSYRIGSRQIDRANLSVLYAMQKQLQSQVLGEQESPLMADTVVAVFDGR